MKKFNPLFKIDSKGKTRVYYVLLLDNGTKYRTTTGILDGKRVHKDYIPIPKGKNTLEQQVEKDAQSKWNKKYQRELYSEDLAKPHPLAFVQPVLAKDYTKIGHQVDWINNEYVAPRKLNGVRCVAQCINSSVQLTSKKGKVYSIPIIEFQLMEQVFKNNPDLILDGELYIHGVELGDVTHAIAHQDEHIKSGLMYHVFDLVHDTDIFNIRYNQIYNLNLKGLLTIVKHQIIRNEEEMVKAHDKYVAEGYEGTMIRDINSLYERGKRSLGLFKRKAFQDSEFDIVDVDEDKEGGAILILQTKSGIQFRSRPMGTDAYRKELLINKNKIIGKQATARYSTLLATGVPEFNRTIAIRDYE